MYLLVFKAGLEVVSVAWVVIGVGTKVRMELSIASLLSTSYEYLLALVLEDVFFGCLFLRLKSKTSLNSYSFSFTNVNVAMGGKLFFSG